LRGCCWIAIRPEERIYEWLNHAVVRRKRLHNDAARIVVEILSEDDLAEAVELEEIKRLMERADEVDAAASPPRLDLLTSSI
jgi:hypothetical protein